MKTLKNKNYWINLYAGQIAAALIAKEPGMSASPIMLEKFTDAAVDAANMLVNKLNITDDNNDGT
jgi:hypothetical protein